jgi:hypothetical protein
LFDQTTWNCRLSDGAEKSKEIIAPSNLCYGGSVVLFYAWGLCYKKFTVVNYNYSKIN